MAESNRCQNFVELLDAYLDDELTAAERAEVDVHLATCSACTKSLDDMRSIAVGLKSLPQLKSTREIDFSFMDGGASRQLDSANAGADCAPIIQLLDAFNDNELGADERVLVEKHLNECSACETRLVKIGQLVHELKTLPKVTPGRDLLADVNLKSPACEEFAELLDAYHDGELSSDEKHRVENHLKECANCARELTAIKQVVAGLKSLPLLTPQRDIVAGLDLPSGGADVPSASKNTTGSVLLFQRTKRVALFTAVAAAVAFVFCINFKPFESNTEIANNASPGANPVSRRGDAMHRPLHEDSSENSVIAETNVSTVTPENISTQETKTASNDSAREKTHSGESIQIANKPPVVTHPVQKQSHEIIPADVKDNDLANEVAVIPDAGNATGADALGIGTDEDGLYEIKI